MRLFLFIYVSEQNIISDISDISNIVIALLTFVLAFYVFIYQKNNNTKSSKAVEEMRKKTIKIEWFKEIIVQPKINNVFTYYEKISSIKNRFTSSDINEEELVEIINYLKKEQSILRKSFLDLIQNINTSLYVTLTENLDNLTGELSTTISNNELKLNNDITYEREINVKIRDSYSQFLSSIINYCGD